MTEDRCLSTWVLVIAGVLSSGLNAGCANANKARFEREDGGESSVARCVQGEQRACACSDGALGNQTCNTSGAFDPCACAAPLDRGSAGTDSGGSGSGGSGSGGSGLAGSGAATCTGTDVRISGPLHNTLGVPIQFEDRPVRIRAEHKVSADTLTDGCVGRLSLEVDVKAGGCTLSVEFGPAFPGGSFGGLTRVSLKADSSCSSVADVEEDIYELADGAPRGYGPLWFGVEGRVPGRMAASSCLDEMLVFPNRGLGLRGRFTGKGLILDLSGLTMRGRIPSTGAATVSCVDSSACGPGFHDDGTGWCVAQGCAVGFFAASSGLCLPLDRNGTGHSDGGTGYPSDGDVGPPPDSSMCGTPSMLCTSAPKFLSAVPLPACCASYDGQEVCGIDGTMLPGLTGLHGCQPANMPGSAHAPACEAVLAEVNHPEDPKNPGHKLPGIMPTAGVYLNFVACCTPDGGCGINTNDIKNVAVDGKQIGATTFGMGCVPFAKLAGIVPPNAPSNPLAEPRACEASVGGP